MRIDWITLKKVVPALSGSFRTDAEDTAARCECWTTMRSVKRAEISSALALGEQAEAVFEVSPIDYADHNRVEHDGTEYKIIHSYRVPGTDTVELLCTKG